MSDVTEPTFIVFDSLDLGGRVYNFGIIKYRELSDDDREFIYREILDSFGGDEEGVDEVLNANTAIYCCLSDEDNGITSYMIVNQVSSNVVAVQAIVLDASFSEEENTVVIETLSEIVEKSLPEGTEVSLDID